MWQLVANQGERCLKENMGEMALNYQKTVIKQKITVGLWFHTQRTPAKVEEMFCNTASKMPEWL